MTDEEFAKSIFPDPWKSGTTDDIVEAIALLRPYDVPSATIQDVCELLIGAMRGEYGE